MDSETYGKSQLPLTFSSRQRHGRNQVELSMYTFNVPNKYNAGNKGSSTMFADVILVPLLLILNIFSTCQQSRIYNPVKYLRWNFLPK